MTYKENIRAILECHFTGFKEDIIDSACNRILEQEPSYNSVNSLVESKLKNPKAKTFDILHFVADNAGLSTFEAIEKAYNMGVSEQEQVLDKIRAEIEEAALDDANGSKFIFVNRVNQIIDKYRTESEDKE